MDYTLGSMEPLKNNRSIDLYQKTTISNWRVLLNRFGVKVKNHLYWSFFITFIPFICRIFTNFTNE